MAVVDGDTNVIREYATVTMLTSVFTMLGEKVYFTVCREDFL